MRWWAGFFNRDDFLTVVALKLGLVHFIAFFVPRVRICYPVDLSNLMYEAISCHSLLLQVIPPSPWDQASPLL